MNNTTDATDQRLKLLSYSSLTTLHSCPRKYQLEKLNEKLDSSAGTDENITFAFGHCVGEGVQEFFSGTSYEQTVWKMYLRWTVDLFAAQEKSNKSFWHAVSAIRQLYAMAEQFSQYDIVYYTGVDGVSRPAVELGFVVVCPDGYKFRGFVDLVLRNRETGEIVVVEVKTTGSSNLNPAKYKNSSQALGYSVVLDSVVHDYSSYKVIYLVFCSSSSEWEQLAFNKTLLQRARWIQQLMLDIEVLKLYEETQYYPQHGESCYNFFKECRFFGNCGLDTKFISLPYTPEVHQKIVESEKQFSISLNIQDLITAQLNKQTTG